MNDDATISYNDHHQRTNVEEYHAHEEIKELVETGGKAAKGHTLLVPREIGVTFHMKHVHLR